MRVSVCEERRSVCSVCENIYIYKGAERESGLRHSSKLLKFQK